MNIARPIWVKRIDPAKGFHFDRAQGLIEFVLAGVTRGPTCLDAFNGDGHHRSAGATRSNQHLTIVFQAVLYDGFQRLDRGCSTNSGRGNHLVAGLRIENAYGGKIPRLCQQMQKLRLPLDFGIGAVDEDQPLPGITGRSQGRGNLAQANPLGIIETRIAPHIKSRIIRQQGRVGRQTPGILAISGHAS
jgi:hypothetical protein